ncbi:hypothetical protein B0H16DRAFT_1743305 [Mycena metata]|uniref:Uncharacterized protein n=1 Tax=Mycena metata TaxID=1033252 RepID=A0AAD7H6V0_9AGAR|nr:hypothetical protein B0H16DRAFT_1743305 [Mycena metata]
MDGVYLTLHPTPTATGTHNTHTNLLPRVECAQRVELGLDAGAEAKGEDNTQVSMGVDGRIFVSHANVRLRPLAYALPPYTSPLAHTASNPLTLSTLRPTAAPSSLLRPPHPCPRPPRPLSTALSRPPIAPILRAANNPRTLSPCPASSHKKTPLLSQTPPPLKPKSESRRGRGGHATEEVETACKYITQRRIDRPGSDSEHDGRGKWAQSTKHKRCWPSITRTHTQNKHARMWLSHTKMRSTCAVVKKDVQARGTGARHDTALVIDADANASPHHIRGPAEVRALPPHSSPPHFAKKRNPPQKNSRTNHLTPRRSGTAWHMCTKRPMTSESCASWASG